VCEFCDEEGCKSDYKCVAISVEETKISEPVRVLYPESVDPF